MHFTPLYYIYTRYDLQLILTSHHSSVNIFYYLSVYNKLHSSLIFPLSPQVSVCVGGDACMTDVGVVEVSLCFATPIQRTKDRGIFSLLWATVLMVATP